jgi:hypothetical protein
MAPAKKKAAKKAPGRKPKGGDKYTIKLTDAVANYYRKLGDGNLTLGIERAAVQSKPS